MPVRLSKLITVAKWMISVQWQHYYIGRQY